MIQQAEGPPPHEGGGGCVLKTNNPPPTPGSFDRIPQSVFSVKDVVPHVYNTLEYKMMGGQWMPITIRPMLLVG